MREMDSWVGGGHWGREDIGGLDAWALGGDGARCKRSQWWWGIVGGEGLHYPASLGVLWGLVY